MRSMKNPPTVHKEETATSSKVAGTTSTKAKTTEKPTTFPPVTNSMIAARAYKLWQTRGCKHGNDVCDWRDAEKELLLSHKN